MVLIDGAKIKAMDPNLFRLLALLFALILFSLAFLCQAKRKLVRSLSCLLALAFLLYKSGEGIYFLAHGLSFIPYEISHLAYWVVPILLLVGFAGSDYASGALSFICGVGFLLGAFISPANLIANLSFYEQIRLLITHELLYFLSLLLLFDFRIFQSRDYLTFLFMMTGFLVYFLLLKYRVIFSDQDFSSYSIALRVMDGSLVAYLAPNPPFALQVGFAILCIALIFLVPFLLIPLGKSIFALRKKKGNSQEEEVPFEQRYGLLPYLKRKKNAARQ